MKSFLVAYDISQDGARARVSARLQQWGDRIQESVFLCRANDEQIEALTSKLVEAINENTDALAILPLCQDCLRALKPYGQYSAPVQVSCWIVV